MKSLLFHNYIYKGKIMYAIGNKELAIKITKTHEDATANIEFVLGRDKGVKLTGIYIDVIEQYYE